MSIIVNGTTLGSVSVDGKNITKVYARQGETGTYVLVFEKGGTVTVALWFGGNWKMNQTKAAIDSYFETFNSALNINLTKKVVIFPPACYLDYVKSKISTDLSDMVEVGIQNIAAAEKGAFTGQISAQMAADCGCKWAMIGESEVRDYLGVTDEDVNKQLSIALANNLKVCVCVGEHLDIREAGTYIAYVQNQLSTIFGQGITASNMKDVTIVYEPIWAIGTGITATPSQAEEMCAVIREWISNAFGASETEQTLICYGGAIKVSSAPDILSQADISGALVGGASLKAGDFSTLINEV